MKRLNLKRLVAAAAVASCAMPALAETALTFTDQSPNRGTRVENTIWLGEQLAERTGGEITVDFHWGGALMKAKAAPQGIGDGAADMGLIIGVYNPSLHQLFGLADHPTQHSDIWVTTRALYEMAQENTALKAEFDKLNLHMVANVTTGPIQLVCKDKEVLNTSDIDGIKLRGVSVYGKVFKDLGGSIVPMSVYDTYQGLDTGLIDCAQMYTYTIPAFKLNEVATSVTMMDWGALMGIAIVMNKDVYESLSAEHQAIVDGVGSEFVDRYAQALAKDNSDAVAKIQSGDGEGTPTEVMDLPADQKQALLEAAAPYLEDWKAKTNAMGIDADAYLAEWHQRLAKYQAELEANGYPWDRN